MNLSPKAQVSLNKVIESFKKGNLKDIVEFSKIITHPSTPSSKWSLSNRLIAYIQAGDMDCRGYKQWQEVNRYVKKGSSAVYIFIPKVTKNIKVVNETEVEEIRIVGYTTIPVFSAQDTYGEGELPNYSPNEFPPLYGVAQRLGIDIKYLSTPEDRLGDCNSVGTIIRLGSWGPGVFFHELAHAVHARIEGPLKKNSSRQEVIAEFIACVLMEMYGYSDYCGHSWSYISKFANDPLLAITSALKTIENILLVITESKEMKEHLNESL